MLGSLTSRRTLLALAFCTTAAPGFAQEGERSGELVYKQLCAVCHGDDGDGKGLVPLDRPARSFIDGGFSFGNTQTAISRTVSAGIGGTPMPGFGSVLSETELKAVADYVIAFGPEPAPAAGRAMILEVGDRPVFVRGHLPAVAPGAPDHPRGLLVGSTDGLSFEYAAQDLRLLAVRQGEFVSREDWQNRGGSPLKPLGRIVHLRAGGKPAAEFVERRPEHIASATMYAPEYRRVLKATEIKKARGWIETQLKQGEADAVATVRENGEAFSLQSAAGYRRTFEMIRHSDAPIVFQAGPGGSKVETLNLDNAGFACFVPSGDDAGTAYFFQTRTLLDFRADQYGVTVGIPADARTAGFAVSTFPLPVGAAAAWAAIKKELLP
jgi:mono/diheme cytochrome c family protein